MLAATTVEVGSDATVTQYLEGTWAQLWPHFNDEKLLTDAVTFAYQNNMYTIDLGSPTDAEKTVYRVCKPCAGAGAMPHAGVMPKPHVDDAAMPHAAGHAATQPAGVPQPHAAPQHAGLPQPNADAVQQHAEVVLAETWP